MNTKKRHPRYRMKVTLSPRLQEILLPILNKKLGIMETFPKDHELIMNANAFMQFMDAIVSSKIPFTIGQLNLEQIDLNKLPERSYINHVSQENQDGKESSSDDH